MTTSTTYLPGQQKRAHWMRLDTAQILKRFFFCERSLVLGEAAWLPSISSITVKTELPHFIWQSALTADALRERVFELRYPSRLMTLDEDASLVQVFDAARDAPSAAAFLFAAGTVLIPALADAYREYLAISDPIADGPTHRFLSLALKEKEEQIPAVRGWTEAMLGDSPDEERAAREWAEAVADRLAAAGGVRVEGPPLQAQVEPLPGARPYSIPDRPGRDPRFHQCRFYWPDNVDPDFPYGEGMALQLRSAVSHLNEVWAVETAGAILWAFADLLPWEWVRDAARWTYDESRHCRMGYERLLAWGFEPAEIPLGSYIYDSAAGQDPIYRLGMLFFFETKNIGKKPARARMFHDYGDAVSEHDMDFDWADETIHASYGKHWLQEILVARGHDSREADAIRRRCGELVEACVATATEEEKEDIKRVTEAMIEKAEAAAGVSPSRHAGFDRPIR